MPGVIERCGLPPTLTGRWMALPGAANIACSLAIAVADHTIGNARSCCAHGRELHRHAAVDLAAIARQHGGQHLGTLIGVIMLMHPLGSFAGIGFGGWSAEASGGCRMELAPGHRAGAGRRRGGAAAAAGAALAARRGDEGWILRPQVAGGPGSELDAHRARPGLVRELARPRPASASLPSSARVAVTAMRYAIAITGSAAQSSAACTASFVRRGRIVRPALRPPGQRDQASEQRDADDHEGQRLRECVQPEQLRDPRLLGRPHGAKWALRHVGQSGPRRQPGLSVRCGFESPDAQWLAGARCRTHVHAITRSACTRRSGGKLRRSACAVFTLSTSSKRVGCSTGSVAGSAPLSNRSTCRALCLALSPRFSP